MSSQNRVIENIKNIILVVLVLTTVLLLYFLWHEKPLSAFILDRNSEKVENIPISSLILPKEVLVSKSGIEFAVDIEARASLWREKLLPEIVKASESATVAVEEISREQQIKSEDYKAVVATFPYSMPFSDFCKCLGIKEWQALDKIGGVSSIGFSESSKESVFLTDEVSGKYYRIITNRKTEIVKELSDISAKNKFPTFYKLDTLFGTQSGKKIFLPIDEPKALPVMSCEDDIAGSSESEQDEIAELYFGKSFDFVRKIKENDGTTRYMYGYGKITLNIEPEFDYLEYKSEPEGSATQNVFEALQTVMEFGSHKKAFESFGGESRDLHLLNLEQIATEQSDGTKKQGYRFEFGPEIDGYDVFFEDKPFLVFEVSGGQVSYFYRSLKSNLRPISAKNMRTVKIVDIIAENHELLGRRLSEKGKTGKNFEDVTAAIQEIQYGYLCRNNELIPVWRIGLGEKEFVYFDPFEAEELN